MATATAPARTAKKTATKPTATKKVAAKKLPTKTMAVKKPKAAPRKSPSQVMLNGESAKNRHFHVDRTLYDQTMDRCEDEGINISDVMRLGLDLYGQKAPAADAVTDGPPVLPRTALNFLKKTYRAGDAEMVNQFLAACHRQGWTVQSLADSMVASGVVDKFSRQAVSLRILKAPDELSEDLPNVPGQGPRRVTLSPRRGKTKDQFAAAGKKAKRHRVVSTYDLAFRITDSSYEPAARRAKHENAMMSRVLDEIMENYLSGSYDRHVAKLPRAVANKAAAAATEPAEPWVPGTPVAKKTKTAPKKR